MKSLARHSSDHLAGSIGTTRTVLAALALASAAATLTATPITVMAQDTAYACTDRSGGVGQIQARLTSVRFAQHAGYDRIVFEFADARAVPSYKLAQQTPTFVTDPKGERKTLEGSAGLWTRFEGTDWTNGVPFSAARPELPVIREVAEVGNFEGITSYGIGLSTRSCFRTLELAAPARLVIDFAAPADQATATPVASSDPTSATPPAVGSLAATGHSAGHLNPSAADNRWPLVAGLVMLLVAVVLGGFRLGTWRIRS
jgi:hypothetical protein